jgi:tetratricopeptide (TPR) repeat protein
LAANYSGRGLLQKEISKGDEAMQSYEHALTILRKITGAHPHERKYQVMLAGVLSNMGEYRLYRTHEPARALKDYEAAIAAHDKLSPEDAGDVTAQDFLAAHYRGVANCQFYLNEKEKCLKANQEAMAIVERLARQNPRVTRFQSQLATGLVNLGQSLMQVGNLIEARRTYGRAIEVGLESMKTVPDESEFPYAVAQAHNSRGAVTHLRGQLEDAASDQQSAIRYMHIAIEKAPHVSEYYLFIGNYYLNLGRAQLQMGHPEDARKTWQGGPEHWEKFIKEHPTNFGFKDRVAEKLMHLAIVQTEAGMTEDGRASWRRAMEISAEVIKAKPDDMAFRTKMAEESKKYALLILHQGSSDEAAEAAQRCIELQQAVCVKEPTAANQRLLVNFQLTLELAQAALHRKEQALDSLRVAREVLDKISPRSAEDDFLLACIGAQKSTLEAKDQSDRARQEMSEALQNLTRALQNGYKDFQRIKTEPALAPLRSQEDFRRQFAALYLDERLPAILAGKDKPANTIEKLTLAIICGQHKKLYAASARFYSAAFDDLPKLMEDRVNQHRYNAACVAALAGCGQGADAAKLEAAKRAELRKQALKWLRADFSAWNTLKEDAKHRSRIMEVLKHWQVDTDFAGVRGTDSLAKLPAEESAAWQKLWSDVADFLEKLN